MIDDIMKSDFKNPNLPGPDREGGGEKKAVISILRGSLNYQFLTLAAVFIMAASGCQKPMRKPQPPCPGIASPLGLLMSRSQKAVGLRANGQCLFRYYADGKQHEESFPVKVWGNPPAQIYLQGDVAFDARGLVVGSNESEFWLWLRPKEISSYWWGKWSGNGGLAGLVMNPRILLEVFGAIEAETEDRWSFSRESGFLVVTRRHDDGTMRKLYLNGGQCAVSRIEYYDAAGRVTVFAEMSDYKEAAEGFFVPREIRIVRVEGGEGENSVKITLSSVRQMTFTQPQKEGIFRRTPPKGFKHVYEIVDGEVVEQVQ